MPPSRPPDPDELEVSVFGPGIGESILVHLSDGAWIVVDSCVDHRTRRPVALTYLEDLGVDPARAIKLVVATHWHDDHVRGISDVFDAATSARFVCSDALRTEELLQLACSARRISLVNTPSGVQELADVLETLQRRRPPGARAASAGPEWAVDNRRLLSDPTSTGHRAEVLALSPSSGAVTLARQEIATKLPEIGTTRRRLACVSPNQASVVLWIDVAGTRVLLGADLETSPNPLVGWRAILALTPRAEGRAHVVKVPHHGSENADDPEVWTQLLDLAPYAVLTPYATTPLPRPRDLERLKGRTPNLYCTARPRRRHPPKRQRAVDRMADEVARARRAVEGKVGQVRLRRKLTDPTTPFSVELLAGALLIA